MSQIGFACFQPPLANIPVGAPIRFDPSTFTALGTLGRESLRVVLTQLHALDNGLDLAHMRGRTFVILNSQATDFTAINRVLGGAFYGWYYPMPLTNEVDAVGNKILELRENERPFREFHPG